jgi:hypothetical protein
LAEHVVQRIQLVLALELLGLLPSNLNLRRGKFNQFSPWSAASGAGPLPGLLSGCGFGR